MVYNIRPKQLRPIPWGWRNEQTPWGPVVVEPRGAIRMPTLASHFDWDIYTVERVDGYEDLNHEGAIITRDMKSVFQTAARFLGWEKLLTEQPSLSEITRGFIGWNLTLFTKCPVKIHYLVIGDDYANNLGMMISPDLWRSWIRPHLERIIDLASTYHTPVIMHSDGNITEILDDLVEMGVYAIHPCMDTPCLENETEYRGVKLLHALPDFNIHDYAPE